MVWRFRIFFKRLMDYILHFHLRLWRFFKWIMGMTSIRGSHAFARWVAGIILLAFDILPVAFLMECLLDWIKWKTRPLNKEEKAIAAYIFGANLPLHLITLDSDSMVVKRNRLKAYVAFHMINFDTCISPVVFIHELVHIWQYRTYGAVYISEALWAQRWGGGYNYGGNDALKLNDNIGLSAFNFEQQADIVEDYFRLQNDLPLKWSVRDVDIENVLKRYIIPLKA